MESATALLKSAGSTVWNHKFKFIFLLIALYGAKKAYDLYKFVKPFLDLKNQLTGSAPPANNQPGSNPQSQGQSTPSQKALDSLISSNPHLKQTLKLFKSTLKSINMTLTYQP